MCLTLGVTILASTTKIHLVLSYQCTEGEHVYSAKASMYLLITLVFFTSFYMHLVSPSVDSDYIAGWICTFHQT